MKQILSRLFNHEHLSEAEARQLLLDITAGRYPDAQVAALLTAFCMRDITVDELTGFREALMQTRVPIDFAPYRPIDIVGTGGDGKNTFNISTCACFVVAGAGYKVAKHGNYGATSVSGASDVIEEHGIRFTADPDTLRRYDAVDINVYEANLFHTKMMVKDIDLQNYLFNTDVYELPPRVRLEIMQNLRREMIEIFSGRNIY